MPLKLSCFLYFPAWNLSLSLLLPFLIRTRVSASPRGATQPGPRPAVAQRPSDPGPSSTRHCHFPRVLGPGVALSSLPLGQKRVSVCPCVRVCVCACASTRLARRLIRLVRGPSCARSVSRLKWKSRSIVTCRTTNNNGNKNNRNSMRVSEVLGRSGRGNTPSQH